jgi:hypothetical protein
MENSWLTSRKEFFLRNMVQDFFEAAVYFDQLCDEHTLTGLVAYTLLDTWIGTESKKGPLWNLKDECHRLFRNNVQTSNLYEHLFDWSIGSIFHETIKLKEDAYQLEAYRPLLELEVYRQDATFTAIINESLAVIENAYSSLADELLRIRQLFLKALGHLKLIFPSHRNNMLLVRFLLDNDKLLSHKVFGDRYCTALLAVMFPEGLYNAYLSVARHCMVNGRQESAGRYLKKAASLAPDNTEALMLLREIANTQRS